MDFVADFNNFSLFFVDNNDRRLAYVSLSRSNLDLWIFHVHSSFDIAGEEIAVKRVVSIVKERADEGDRSNKQLDKRYPKNSQDHISIFFANPSSSVSVIRQVVAPP